MIKVLGSLKDYLANLEEVTMDVIFLIDLSRSFDSLWEENVISFMCWLFSENDSILGSL